MAVVMMIVTTIAMKTLVTPWSSTTTTMMMVVDPLAKPKPTRMLRLTALEVVGAQPVRVVGNTKLVDVRPELVGDRVNKRRLQLLRDVQPAVTVKLSDTARADGPSLKPFYNAW
ncbi:hypothetical protein PR001_g2300 [Phytophthora rubi]|uniref:Secreted protein n=1 Tax=Phytophthora rubi TaxID=129364 RepID=A0A6A3NIK0_9STRA|nr:hypothetical protein PR002_g2272 [Phytophthora rubi]KAE9050542.1 hypothetical protein PR001_g2300 [Phytophthora rubi]